MANEHKTKVGSAIKKMLVDVTSMDVTTLTGNITINDLTIEKNNSGRIDFKNIAKSISGGIADASKINLVATTHVDFDKDAVQYIKENLSPEDQTLLDLHNEMVINSTKARAAMLESLISIFKGL